MHHSPPSSRRISLHMVRKDRRSRILLEELGCRPLKHHTDVEVEVTHLLGDVGSGVDGDHEVQPVLAANRVDQILIPRNPILPSIPAVDDFIEEDALNQVAIPMLSPLQLLKDVFLGELGCIRNTSVILRIGIDRGAILSLDVEQKFLCSCAKSELTLLLEVYLLRFPVAAVAVKDDVSEVVPELQCLSPLGELSWLSILVVVRPVVGYRRVVPCAVLEWICLPECVFDISLLTVGLGCLVLGEISVELRGNRILTGRATLSSRSGRTLRSRRASWSDCTVIALGSGLTICPGGTSRSRGTLNTIVTFRSGRASRTPRSFGTGNRGSSSSASSRSRRTLKTTRAFWSGRSAFTSVALGSGRASRTWITLRPGRSLWTTRARCASSTATSTAERKRGDLRCGVSGHDVNSSTLSQSNVLDDVELGGIDVDGVGPGARWGYSSARSQHLDVDSASLVCPNHVLAH